MTISEGSAVRVSVIVVSDYEPGEKSWADERAAVRALIDDDPGFPFEIIIMEAPAGTGDQPEVPADIAALAPKVRVHFGRRARSAALKDAGLEHCRADLIAVVEADSVPQKGWLRRLVAAIEADPSLDVVGGRTIYGFETAMLRVTSLLDRGFNECRFEGRYGSIPNNGALYRRAVLERFPYPDDSNPSVSAALRLRTMRDAGIRIGIEPRAVMRHAFGGFGFLVDVRRNKGFHAARLLVLSAPEAAARPAIVNALAVVRHRLGFDWNAVRQVGGLYLKPSDWPLLLVMHVLLRIPEFAGALQARRPDAFAASTAYR